MTERPTKCPYCNAPLTPRDFGWFPLHWCDGATKATERLHTMCNNPECIKLRQDLKEAWERILKMDQELKLINQALDQMQLQVIPDAPKA